MLSVEADEVFVMIALESAIILDCVGMLKAGDAGVTNVRTVVPAEDAIEELGRRVEEAPGVTELDRVGTEPPPDERVKEPKGGDAITDVA